ncbi:MAG: ammonium transporter [Desulfobacteraceae bacterium]
MKRLHVKKIVPTLFAMIALPGAALAGDGAAAVTGADAVYVANNTWMLISAFLVFIMHLGFASLEAGLTRSKNTVNILFKNTAIIAIGLLTYAAVGFNLMYPGDFSIAGFFGFAGFGIGVAPENMMVVGGNGVGIYTYWTDFIFQAMFAATAATIVSGAVAERIKLHSFLIFSTIYVAIVYPWVGSWKWGGGWLDAKGFYDFAGSTLVHSVGGWAALAGVLLLGPRLGKYTKNGIKPIMGHSMPLATIGVFLLWLGWFGFNGGSVLSADPELVSFVFVTTSLAAAGGIAGAITLSWILQKKPDLSMALNGSLAGLVGITAGADAVSVMSSIVIGLIAGALVVAAVLFIDRIKIDDPVGAISVHLICGIWGTLAVGIFSPDFSLGTQLLGVVSYAAVCFPAAFILFFILKATLGIRVDAEEEKDGLDVGEHGMLAYADFESKNV